MKFIKSLLLAVLVFCGATAAVEAATIAIVPLINNVEFNTAGEENVPNMIFYHEAVSKLKKTPGYSLVDSARLRHAVEDNMTPGRLPGKEQLMVVSKKANVDIVVAAVLNNYGNKPAKVSAHEANMKMDVKARVVSYNRLTGKFTAKNYEDESVYDATLQSRYDLVQESWGRLVRRMFSDIAKTKAR